MAAIITVAMNMPLALLALLGWSISTAEAVVPAMLPRVPNRPVADAMSDELDFVSLVSVSTELKRAPPASAQGRPSAHPVDAQDLQGADWEQRFAVGEQVSRQFTDADEQRCSWSRDVLSAGGGAVPTPMAEAEELLVASEDAPQALWKEKTAVRSLRLYHHAKWLAERGHARAAETRFKAAAELAKRSRRSVLASHALGRLGYFLLQWRRAEEAKEALVEAERLNSKSNPLAIYLLGVLLRKEAGAGIGMGADAAADSSSALMAAEERVLKAGTQPSDELEAERLQLIADIEFWRAAQSDPRQCAASQNVAHVLICVFGHVGMYIRHSLFGSTESLSPAPAPQTAPAPARADAEAGDEKMRDEI